MEAALLRWPIGFVQKFNRFTWHIADGWLAMNSIAIIQRLHQHRRWVNENLLAAANPLSDEQLHRSFPMGQGSIWKSLVHLYAAEFVWLEALLGNDNALVRGDLPGRIPGNQQGQGGFTSLQELREEWTKLADR